jgi:O-methyltransferase involved in polyketide biosynthesis
MAGDGPIAAGTPNDGRVKAGSVLGIRIPADECSALALVVLRLSASELSAAIGGGLLEDALVGEVGDAWLGGKDNLAVDREIAARVAEVAPLVVAAVRANRAFVRRATAFLAESGLEQYIDLGSGLPTGENVHEIAGRIREDARVAYVDNDPVVQVYARALLADSGRTIVVEGDVRDPERLLADPDLLAHIDFRRPVAVILAAILHFVPDEQDPARIIRVFREVMAPGSALVITHAVEGRHDDGAGVREGARIYSESAAPLVIRSLEQVATWFDGFTVVPPGVANADTWGRTGNGRVTAPVVAALGFLDGPATGSGAGLARRREGERRDG